LPIPQIEISLYQGSGNSRDSPSNSSLTAKDFNDAVESTPAASVAPTILQQQKSNEKCGGDDSSSANESRRPSKKRVKMADLRTLIETKILSKSDRGLEKIGTDTNGNNGKPLQHTVRNI
jgi:protein unc-80